MQLLTYELNNFCEKETAVALGTFDGLHIGHKQILDNAGKSGLPVVAYSFANIPAAYFGKPIKALLTRDEKIAAFREYGVDYLLLVPFDEMIMNMSARDFLDFLYYKLNARVISCGFNYSFGRNAEGNPELLMEYCAEKGIQAMIAEPVMLGSETISSTHIREALNIADLSAATQMLGRYFSLSGSVTHGKRLGNTIGFPTANIPFSENKITPKFGVYATKVIIDGVEYPAMTNVGVRPTVEKTDMPNSETYIIGYDGDLYGKHLKIDFLDYIREEKRFSGVEELQNQLKKDEKTALQMYNLMIL
ncbi:MAG: bifunctional riboflavin kinase/FAD synthetase [Christensenellaceae bacterium]|nr:bifunctional riboflavin kinase/FAD synthetase [Christensenellaceae bacterium]